MTRRRRPTRAAAAVIACGVLLILLSGPAQAMWLAVTGALVLGVPVASALSRPGLDGAALELTAPAVVTTGDQVRVAVVVRAATRHVAMHRLALTGPPFGDAALLVGSLRCGATARTTVEVSAGRRGRYPAQEAVASTGAPFGLLLARRAWSVPCPVDVGAQVIPVPPHALRTLTGAAEASADRRRGAGDEVHAVREFRTGDAMRDVHWRSTARTGRLVVREYERAVPTRTAVVVSGGVAGLPFEALVVAATSIAHATWRSGEPVDVVRCEPDGVVVTRSVSRHGLHAWSAAVQPGPAEMADVVRTLLAAGAPSAVVLAAGPGSRGLSAACAELARAGCHVSLVVLPDTEPGSLPAHVTVRVLRPGVDLAAALAGAAA